MLFRSMASALNGELLPFVQDYWFLCSIVAQLLLAALFLKLAALFLDPLRRKEKARKSSNSKKKRKKADVSLLFFLLVLSILAAKTPEASAKVKFKALDKEGKITITKDNISATVSLGYKGKSKYGRDIRGEAVIENKGSDFAGKFRIEYSRDRKSVV